MKFYAPYASTQFNLIFEQQLDMISDDIHSLLGNNLVALILGGGYGRHEGGSVVRLGQEYPYNDLDMVMVVKHKWKVPTKKLDELLNYYSRLLSIDVDISRPLTLKDIRNWPHYLMWHDLYNSHVVLYGDANILINNAPRIIQESPPLIEVTRLLLNRGSGLLWSFLILKGEKPLPDPDFIRRNYYKTLLAIGDALLIANQKYTTRYHDRTSSLEKILQNNPCFCNSPIADLYSYAIHFRLQPDSFNHLTIQHRELQAVTRLWENMFLYIENLRCGMKWTDMNEYASYNGLREREQNGSAQWLRNAVRNLQLGQLSLSYPRELLYRTLPLLLQGNCKEVDANRYLAIWQRFN